MNEVDRLDKGPNQDHYDASKSSSVAGFHQLERNKHEENKFYFKGELDLYEDEEDYVEVDDPSETVCCICDNGGDVICCDGPCMRSFHASKDASGASDCNCSTLNLKKGEAEGLDLFFCPNCKYKQHQCYICKKLGCSDEAAGAAQEVFLCDSAMCGHFYHPDCVAQMLLKDAEEVQINGLADSIKKGNGFVCPMHKCWLCKKGENKSSVESQFGVCRRCPRVWHRKCFPKFLRFKQEDDKPQRAWEGLLSDRVLIYCIEHKIVRKLCTPARTQVEFPEIPSLFEKNKLDDRKKRRRLIKLASKELSFVGLVTTKKTIAGLKAIKVHPESASRKRKQAAACESSRKRLGTGFPTNDQKIKQGEGRLAGISKQSISHKSINSSQGKVISASSLKENNIPKVERHIKAIVSECKQSLPHKSSKVDLTRVGSDLQSQNFKQAGINESKQVGGYDLMYEQYLSHAETVRPQDTANVRNSVENICSNSGKIPALPLPHEGSKPFFIRPLDLDAMTKSIIQGLISKTKRSVTLESIREQYDTPLCYQHNLKNLDKKYSRVKIESIMKGVQKAVATLVTGGNIEDAEAQCAPTCLKFLEGCKVELRVFLAPFLHGDRYTPFGRHFTKPEKLQEIVDRLHWYVHSGDMIVDFCCGSNIFSLMMKAKLDQTGKICEYKNFDIIQAKHNFNFVKKDWFKVEQHELANGGRLVMGLNPPFGVKARLANLFINHALKFRPKVLILIVPRETQRLDHKAFPYDLIWEDSALLKGHAFELPGSVGTDGKPLSDWNKEPPILSVWSRPDWTTRHKQTAAKFGHIPEFDAFQLRQSAQSREGFPTVGMQERAFSKMLPSNGFVEAPMKHADISCEKPSFYHSRIHNHEEWNKLARSGDGGRHPIYKPVDPNMEPQSAFYGINQACSRAYFDPTRQPNNVLSTGNLMGAANGSQPMGILKGVVCDMQSKQIVGQSRELLSFKHDNVGRESGYGDFIMPQPAYQHHHTVSDWQNLNRGIA